MPTNAYSRLDHRPYPNSRPCTSKPYLRVCARASATFVGWVVPRRESGQVTLAIYVCNFAVCCAVVHARTQARTHALQHTARSAS